MKAHLFTLAFFVLFSIHLNAQSHVWALTLNGGAFNQGSIIICNNDGSGLNVAHSFQGPAGYHPYGDLLQANDGNLYGTCYDGGTYGSCTIFKLEMGTGIYTDVYSFDIMHGDYPKSGVVEGPNGKLYGAASAGGSFGGGVIYSYDINTGVYTDLHDLNGMNGTIPYGNPILNSDGKLYGMTTSGGLYSSGVIYSYDIISDTYTSVHDFNVTNGSNPKGSLVVAGNGLLYGMTSSGGINGGGVLFSFAPAEGIFTKLFDFNSSSGSIPQSSLVQGSDGLLYGMTSAGGSNSNGVIFSFDLSNNVYTALHNFNSPDGATPLGRLLQSGNILCGSTSYGGANGMGVMFNYDMTNGSYTKVLDFDGSNGANPNGGFIAVFMTTGLQPHTRKTVTVFPNPVIDKVNVVLSEEIKQGTIKLLDHTGRVIAADVETDPVGISSTIDLGMLSSGIYFLQVSTGEKQYTEKIIKE